MKSRAFTAAVLSYALVLVGACTSNQQDDQEIRIGLFSPFSGSTASFGMQLKKGVEFAVQERNSKGGIGGKKILLISEDDRGESGEAQNAVTKLITQHHVVAILGNATSSGTLAGAPVSQHYRIPMITPTATNPRVTEIGDCIFRVCWIDTFQGEVMATFALARLNIKNVSILYDVSSDYSVGLKEVFVREFQSQGGRILKVKSYSAGDTDFSAPANGCKGRSTECRLYPRLLHRSRFDYPAGPTVGNRVDPDGYGWLGCA